MILAFFKRFVPHIYVGDKTDTVAVTFHEGDEWYEFPPGASPSSEGWRVHSILFQDGSTWDAMSGWRGERFRVDAVWIRRRNGKFAWWRAQGSGKVTGWCEK